MRNETKGSKTTEATEANTESTSGAGKGSKSKGTTTETAGKGRVFTVPSGGGEITTAYRQAAIDDCTGDTFTKETVEKMLSEGEVVFSDDFYYCEFRVGLAKWETGSTDAPVVVSETLGEEISEDFVSTETPAEDDNLAKHKAKVIEEAQAKEPEAGDVVVHLKKKFLGELVDGENGTFNVSYTDAKGKPATEIFIKARWRMATADEFFQYINSKPTSIETTAPTAPATDLEKPNDAPIEGEVIEAKPLTKKEQKMLDDLETAYEKVDAVERAAPFEKGRILNEIRVGNLFRATHKTFGEYAIDRFGITREYAQNLAQIANIPELAASAVEGGVELNMSVNTANQLMRDTNRIGKALGIGKVEFEVMLPIFRNAMTLMVDTAPKDANGNVELTPRVVESFNKVLSAHITDGVVEIDGKQMTIRAAAENGLLNASLRSEVIASAAEGIKTQESVILSEFKQNLERQESNIPNGGGETPDDTKYYRGKVPTLGTVCSKHGDTEIMSVGAGKIVTRCGCKWHMDATSGELTAYEVDEKRVKA